MGSKKCYCMSGRALVRSFDRDRRSLFRDREVIADLCLIKRSHGDRDREIWGSRSFDRAIVSLNKTEHISVNNHG